MFLQPPPRRSRVQRWWAAAEARWRELAPDGAVGSSGSELGMLGCAGAAMVVAAAWVLLWEAIVVRVASGAVEPPPAAFLVYP